MLVKTQKHQFGIVDKNCKFKEALYNVYITKDLCLHAYKIQLIQQLKPNDHEQRREFVKWIINHQKMDAGFSSKIILNDEAHFHFDGFVNRQNCHVSENV